MAPSTDWAPRVMVNIVSTVTSSAPVTRLAPLAALSVPSTTRAGSWPSHSRIRGSTSACSMKRRTGCSGSRSVRSCSIRAGTATLRRWVSAMRSRISTAVTTAKPISTMSTVRAAARPSGIRRARRSVNGRSRQASTPATTTRSATWEAASATTRKPTASRASATVSRIARGRTTMITRSSVTPES